VDGIVGVDLFSLDELRDGRDVVEILEHHLVRLEEQRGVLAGLFAGLFRERAQLRDGLVRGLAVARGLFLRVRDLHALHDGLLPAVKADGTACDAGGHAGSL